MHQQDDSAPRRSETGQFLPGYSGNLAGRPRGSRNRACSLRDLVASDQAASIARLVVDRAIAGEGAASRSCFSRLFPPAKEAPIFFDLPPIASLADAIAAGASVIEATGAGELPPGDARKLMALIAAQLKMIQSAERQPTGAAQPAETVAAKPPQPVTPEPADCHDPADDTGAESPATCISPVIAAPAAAGTDAAADAWPDPIAAAPAPECEASARSASPEQERLPADAEPGAPRRVSQSGAASLYSACFERAAARLEPDRPSSRGPAPLMRRVPAAPAGLGAVPLVPSQPTRGLSQRPDAGPPLASAPPIPAAAPQGERAGPGRGKRSAPVLIA